MAYAHKNIIFMTKKQCIEPETAYLEDVLLVESTEIEKSIF